MKKSSLLNTRNNGYFEATIMNIKNTDITELKGESLDIVKQNIQQLKQLFPNVFTEEKIDFDALKSELGEYYVISKSSGSGLC